MCVYCNINSTLFAYLNKSLGGRKILLPFISNVELKLGLGHKFFRGTGT